MDWRDGIEPRKGIRHKTTYTRPDGTKFTVEHMYVLGMPVLNLQALKQAEIIGGSRGKRASAKLRILARDGNKCVICGSPDNLTIDHRRYPKDRYVTRQRAEDYPADECQTLCVVCHKDKNKRNGRIFMNCADCGRKVTFEVGEEPENLAFCWEHSKEVPDTSKEKKELEEMGDGK